MICYTRLTNVCLGVQFYFPRCAGTLLNIALARGPHGERELIPAVCADS